MELYSILHFLEHKSILVTGATGFLAKVFIEKIIRVQPNVKKLYLLLRAADSKSALHRFNTEVIGKELFKVVKEKYGTKLDSLISDKVTLVPGDIALEGLGIKEQILGEIDIVINLAATTNFDERYDVALRINTFGPANVLNFSKKCSRLKAFLHVSTAYVCGEKEGLVLETPFKMGDTLNGTYGLDINTEKQLVEEKLNELQSHNASEKHISSTMKDLGIQRAKKYGWPNTYAFTKAMGEMMLGQLKDNISLVIIRPTVVISTYKEPFPGWTEGLRHIDSFILGYGKGKMTCFIGDPLTVVDLIPADMVVNAMIVAMAAHANESSNQIVYHVGTSMANPVTCRRLQDYTLHFFTERPWINKDGKPVIVSKATEFVTKDVVHTYIQMHYLIPLKILSFINTLSCQYFEGTYLNLSRKVKFLMRLVELFSPYLFFKGVFDDMNTEKLRRAARESDIENEIFYFDPKSINWDDNIYTHIAGVVKYAFK